ncbi:MAG: hypothetical protein Q9161_004740 [Pseudevernia consocians]
MAAVNRHATEEHTWKIYRLTLVEKFVGIQDMHPEQWHEPNEDGRGTRTSSKTNDHNGDMCSYEMAYLNSKR